MKPFLKSIASAFVKNTSREDLSEYCFVFPNRRSGLFFKKYLNEETGGSLLLPEITTISDFTCDLTHNIEASRIELLFLLYDEYRKCILDSFANAEDAENTIASFDQFIFWGDMILSDFNDVDKYLASAEDVFKNVKELNEIKSNYVDKELAEILSQYFDLNSDFYDYTTEFWRHTGNKENDSENGLKSKFIKFWEILWPLYKRFNARLKEEKKAYSGMIYRESVELLKETGLEDLAYKKYIFIGFSMLSKSEYAIFKLLDKKKIADFYWDFNSILFNKENKGSIFVSKYKSEFKSELDIEQSDSKEVPEINVLSIPSNTGQTKYINSILTELVNEGNISDKANAINTAIVLPDENLFIPTLSSIDSSIEKVNITMGYPMKYTSAATLMRSISMLQNRARKESDEWAFFHEDVKNILTHPYIQKHFSEGISEMLEDIDKNNLFTIKEKCFSGLGELAKIFKPVTELNNRQEVFAYFDSVIDTLIIPVSDLPENLEYNIFNQYRISLNQIEDIISDYSYDLKGRSFMYLVERTLSSSTITFQGEPLKGLQIMGVLETRCLDFDNIIILSMNEKVFPRKHFSKSFIPNNLRKGHGLATTEFQESIYTYYFYRMLSRAKHAYLLYDSRTAGLGSGEPSRYIYQLKYLYKNNIPQFKFRNGIYSIKIQKSPDICIEKDDRIYQEIMRFSSDSDCPRNLSASSINEYVKCPFCFYLDKIEGIQVEDEMTDFIDSKTMGSIVHEVMQKLYEPKMLNHELVTKADVDAFLKDTGKLVSKLIVRTINKYLYKKKEDELDTPLEGNSLLIFSIVENYIHIILEEDKGKCPMEIIGLEKEDKGVWILKNGISINYKQIIDRIDRPDRFNKNQCRIVDYKTGSDETTFSDIDLFSDKNWSKKAIRQLFMYCNYYRELIGDSSLEIKPVIYDIKKGRKFKIIYNRTLEINNLEPKGTLNEEFVKGLDNVIAELFDKNKPFYQTRNEKNCEYCNFKDICHR